MHHYIYNILYKDTVDEAIENNQYDNDLITDIKNQYYYQYKQYRKKLYQYVINQKIEMT